MVEPSGQQQARLGHSSHHLLPSVQQRWVIFKLGQVGDHTDKQRVRCGIQLGAPCCPAALGGCKLNAVMDDIDICCGQAIGLGKKIGSSA